MSEPRITWTPTMCRGCGKLPAVMGYYERDAPEPSLFWCWECGTPCGDDCCGMFVRYGDAERICALWAMSTGTEVWSDWLGVFPAPVQQTPAPSSPTVAGCT
jgi:hypothetical protein